jgi:hypothetical protein
MSPLTTVPAMTREVILVRGLFPELGGPGADCAEATIEHAQATGRIQSQGFAIHISHLPVTTVVDCGCYLNRWELTFRTSMGHLKVTGSHRVDTPELSANVV